MKRNVLTIVSLFLITNSLLAGYCQAIHHEIDSDLYYQEESSLHSTFQKYFSSVIPGLVVGANTGILCAVLDHTVPPLWPLFWLGSYALRTKMVNDISNNYQKRHVRHDKVLMELCAIISTWVSYYKIYEAVHGNPPF